MAASSESAAAAATTTTYSALDTVYSADSVEWCPIPDYTAFVACGTYQLVPATEAGEGGDGDDEPAAASSGQKNKRVGRLLLLRHDTDPEPARGGSLQLLQTIDLPAILDMKWLCSGEPDLLLALASGEIAHFRLHVDGQSGDDESPLTAHFERVGDDLKLLDALCLSLDTNRAPGSPSRIPVSREDGTLSLLELCDRGLKETRSWHAHDMEMWITALDYDEPSLVYTGADDCLFRGWDLRTDCQRPIFTSKRHSMGVCSMQAHHQRPHCLATGSYDESVLIWDTRQMRQPVQETTPGGGVWRIKWHPLVPSLMLTASMYEAFHVLDVPVDGTAPQVVASYRELAQDALAYGADWARGPGRASADPDGPHLAATCSFYDHQLRLWDVAR